MISAQYPVLDTDYFLEVSIDLPEPDPKSKNGSDKRCYWKVSSLNFEISDFCYGIDEMQCVYLAFENIKRAMIVFEDETGKKCEYNFFPDIS